MTDTIVIVGAGVTGMTAALACAEAGARVTVVERGPIVGGTLAAAMTDNPSFSPIDEVAIPKLSAIEQNENIEILTLASLEQLDGRAGNFDVAIRERARFVTDACTRCNHCRPVCPAVGPNAYDAGLTFRKAIYAPLPQTLPEAFVIDIDSCLNLPPNYLPCNHCVEVCDDDAIHFDTALDRLHRRQAAAVILAPGCSSAVDPRLADFGYGTHPDIVTTAELQRMLQAPGPSGGFATRPSNEEYAESVLLIVDDLTPYSVYTALTLTHQLVNQDVGAVTLLITTQPEDNEQLQRLPAGVNVAWGLVQKIEADDDSGIAVSYVDFTSNHLPEARYDLVVLGADPLPDDDLPALAAAVDCDLDVRGFVAAVAAQRPAATTRAGVYAAGGASGPATLPDTVAQATSAAAAALADLDPRLLRAEYAAAGERAPEAHTAATDAQLRAQIERALHAFLRRSD